MLPCVERGCAFRWPINARPRPQNTGNRHKVLPVARSGYSGHVLHSFLRPHAALAGCSSSFVATVVLHAVETDTFRIETAPAWQNLGSAE